MKNNVYSFQEIVNACDGSCRVGTLRCEICEQADLDANYRQKVKRMTFDQWWQTGEPQKILGERYSDMAARDELRKQFEHGDIGAPFPQPRDDAEAEADQAWKDAQP